MTIIVTTFITTLLLATGAQALGVKFLSKSLPASAKVGNTSTFSANIEYDSEIYGVPTPQQGKFHVEVPRLYNLPTFSSGSLSGWNFTAKTGARTGKSVWETNKGFFILGVETRNATFKAKAVSKGSSQSYIGTGPGTAPAAHELKNVTVN
jgi:hypothetical protein